MSDILEEVAENFDTPEGVNRVMYTLFFELVEGRISERKAGILTYMAQTILHSHRAIAMKQKVDQQAQQYRPIICDLPGPVRPGPRYDLVTGEIIEEARPEDEANYVAARKSSSEGSADFPVSSLQDNEMEKTVVLAPSAETGSGVDSDGGEEIAGVKASATLKTERPASESGRYTKPGEEENGTGLKTGHYTKPEEEKSTGLETRHYEDADLNHFFPVDPTLPAHLQDPRRAAPLPPSEAGLDRRNRQFDRAHGFVRRGKQSYPAREDADWKILNGR